MRLTKEQRKLSRRAVEIFTGTAVVDVADWQRLDDECDALERERDALQARLDNIGTDRQMVGIAQAADAAAVEMSAQRKSAYDLLRVLRRHLHECHEGCAAGCDHDICARITRELSKVEGYRREDEHQRQRGAS